MTAHFSPDGQKVATTSVDHTARVWDGFTGEPLTPSLVHPDWVTCARFVPDGKLLITGCRDGTIWYWDVEKGTARATIPAQAKPVTFLEFSPDGRRFLSGSDEGYAFVWSFPEGSVVGKIIEHRGAVRDGCFSPDGKRVATACADGTARISNVETGAPLSPPLLHANVVSVVRFSPDGAWLATASFDQTVRLWDGWTGNAVSQPLIHDGSLRWIEFSPDGRWLLTGAGDGTAVVRDATSGARRLTLEHPAPLRLAEFSPDAKRILTVARDETVRVWEGPSVRLLTTWSPHTGEVRQARFSPDGAAVVTASDDQSARLWEAATGRPVSGPLVHRGGIASARFSPDGRYVLTAARDNTAILWGVADGQQKSVFEHDAAVVSARFSPDGRRIVTRSEDRTARLWDVATGQPVASPLEHEQPVQDAAFSPDGTWLAVASGRLVRIWAVPSCPAVAPNWLAPLAEAVAGLRQASVQMSAAVPAGGWLASQRQRSVERQRADSALEPWRAWFCADRSQRNPTPSPTPTLADLLAREEAMAQWGIPSSAFVTAWLLPLQPAKAWLAAQAGCLSLQRYQLQGELRDLHEAEWLVDRAVALAPDQAVTWYHRAYARYQAGDRPGTYESVTRAEGLPGATTRLSLARGQWLEEAGQIEGALTALVRATESEGDGRRLDPPEWRDAWLRRAGLHSRRGETNAARLARQQAYGFAPTPRDPAAPPSLVDLTGFDTGGFDNDWRASGFPRHNLSALPRGRQVLEGVEYDLRGLVQLASTVLEARELCFPRAVEGIPIGPRCARLHFLHAADCAAETGSPLATYTIRRGDGKEEAIPISYRADVLAWDAPAVPESLESRIAWRGASPTGDPVWVFRTSWTNAHPELTVESVTLISGLAGCAPFIVAITAE